MINSMDLWVLLYHDYPGNELFGSCICLPAYFFLRLNDYNGNQR